MTSFSYIDHLLRNRAQVATDINTEQRVKQNTLACLIVFLSLSTLYGLIMGSQNLIRGYSSGWLFSLAAAVKLPMLFLLTLLICLPLFYVLNVLIGPSLRFSVVVGTLLASIAVTSVVLGACAPIVAFFMLSTKSYLFITLLNVLVFTLAGGYGVYFLGKSLHDLVPPAPEGVPDVARRGVSTILNWWLITFGIVGTQMGWILRPFIGNPGSQFSFLRSFESNFYVELFKIIGHLLAGH